MKILRSAVKISLLLVYTLASYLVYLFPYLILRLFKFPVFRLKNFYMRLWSKTLCLILNIRVSAEGTPPKAPFFWVSNHLSYLDIIPIYLYMDCTFVAKKEVRNWPVLGFMVHSMGVIFVDRTKKSDVTRINQEYSSHLNNHQGIVLFPEGTTSGGEDILPFKSSLLEYPAANHIPVSFGSLHYQTHPKDPPASGSVCWFGAQAPFLRHILKMTQNRRIDCKIRFGSTPVSHPDRKELADLLRREIQLIFDPMPQPDAPESPPAQPVQEEAKPEL